MPASLFVFGQPPSGVTTCPASSTQQQPAASGAPLFNFGCSDTSASSTSAIFSAPTGYSHFGQSYGGPSSSSKSAPFTPAFHFGQPFGVSSQPDVSFADTGCTAESMFKFGVAGCEGSQVSTQESGDNIVPCHVQAARTRNRRLRQPKHVNQGVLAAARDPTADVGESSASDPAAAAPATIFMDGANSSAPALASSLASDVLSEIRSHIEQKRFVEAVRACLPSLAPGPEDVLSLLRQSLDDWETAERRRILNHEDEKKSLMSQLMGARERTVKLRQLKEQKDFELINEKQHSKQLEQHVAVLRHKAKTLDEMSIENTRLKRQLHIAQRAAELAKTNPPRDAVIQRVAEIECEPLSCCNSAEREKLRKKLLLKWHPDKQPSPDHVSLATQVMQELQNCDEWAL